MDIYRADLQATNLYNRAISSGSYVMDASALIDEHEPNTVALSYCKASIDREASKAKSDREAYLNEYNLLNYLK